MTRRVQTAADLWRTYFDAGRPIPPTWAARATGASPTAVIARLRREQPLDIRKGHNGRNWNWCRDIVSAIIEGMQIIVGTYQDTTHFLGWIEPADKSWIVFIDAAGKPIFFGERDADGGVKQT